MIVSRREYGAMQAELERLRAREETLTKAIFATNNIPFIERTPEPEPQKERPPHSWAHRRVWLEKKFRREAAQK